RGEGKSDPLDALEIAWASRSPGMGGRRADIDRNEGAGMEWTPGRIVGGWIISASIASARSGPVGPCHSQYSSWMIALMLSTALRSASGITKPLAQTREGA